MIRFFRRRRKMDADKFTIKWRELQQNCANRKTWPQAIIEADELLCEALKVRRYKGKTTGERLVAAQHELSDNESVWFGHKLYKTIISEGAPKLKKIEVITALAGFRQALRDLGALKR
ncbi:MAG TPA: hypothetical protein VLF79_03675 [Candidatus Saccharimonadales bacterium]|nr:hypothetical protein [Candidatus Saccharimonadales bacterium]